GGARRSIPVRFPGGSRMGVLGFSGGKGSPQDDPTTGPARLQTARHDDPETRAMPHPPVRRLLRAPGRPRPSPPPAIEPLEGRRLLAALVVNTTADENDPTNGTLSLREAIEISNGTLAISSLSAQERSQVLGALSSPNEIDFAIPNPTNTLQTIFLTTPLPAIFSPININGETEPGFVPTLTSFPNVNENETDVEVPMVRVDGSLIDRTLYPNANGLTINTVNCGVSSLSITGFSGAGIDLEPGP